MTELAGAEWQMRKTKLNLKADSGGSYSGRRYLRDKYPRGRYPELNTEAESGTTAETGIEPLPGENDELRKATSENGNAAYFGARTTVVLNEETIDIKDRAGNVDAIYDIKAVDGRMP